MHQNVTKDHFPIERNKRRVLSWTSEVQNSIGILNQWGPRSSSFDLQWMFSFCFPSKVFVISTVVFPADANVSMHSKRSIFANRDIANSSDALFFFEWICYIQNLKNNDLWLKDKKVFSFCNWPRSNTLRSLIKTYYIIYDMV